MKKLFSLVTLIAFTALPTATFAQDSELALEEVVVTATKREENVQDIAQTVNAVTGAQLDNYQIRDLSELAQLVSGVQFTKIDPRRQQITMRGQKLDPDGGNDSPIQGYVDEIPLRTGEVFLQMYDTERVEILKGAQGTLLDIDFGSYPFVTSSNTTTAGACIGLGISPKKIDKVFGIFKAYCTRVGAGPFPTELFDDIGEKIAKNGNEFGSTTGRPRRCGWLDLPALKYSIMLNGVSDLYMMKADVLSGFSEVKVCVGYEYNNEKIDYFPSSIESDSIKPIYKSFKGWTSKSNHARLFDDLEDNFKKYINFIESEVGVSIKLVSLGPDREETIYMK